VEEGKEGLLHRSRLSSIAKMILRAFSCFLSGTLDLARAIALLKLHQHLAPFALSLTLHRLYICTIFTLRILLPVFKHTFVLSSPQSYSFLVFPTNLPSPLVSSSPAPPSFTP